MHINKSNVCFFFCMFLFATFVGSDAFANSTCIERARNIIAQADETEYSLATRRFQDYKQCLRTYVRNNAQRHRSRPEHIEGNLPFYHFQGEKTQNSVLLLHGLSDSPYYVQPLGEIFRRAGFNVIGTLTPGHGTNPRHLFNVTVKDWQNTVDFGLEIARELGENVSILGFSAGGTLAFDAVYRYRVDPNFNLAGLFAFVPAFRMTSNYARGNVEDGNCMGMSGYPFIGIGRERMPNKYNKLAWRGICVMQLLMNRIKEHRDAIVQELIDQETAIFALQTLADTTTDADVALEQADLFVSETDFETNPFQFITYPEYLEIPHVQVTRPYDENDPNGEKGLGNPYFHVSDEETGIPSLREALGEFLNQYF